MTSLWDSLPADLRDYILDIRRRYITTIQKCWRRYLVQQRPFVIADAMINIWKSSAGWGPYPGHGYIDTMCPDTSKAIIYCAKFAKITKKTTMLFWMKFIYAVLTGLRIDIYTDGPGAIYRNKAQDAINELINKFDLWYDLDLFDEHEGGVCLCL